MAYFATTETAHNVISTSGIDVSLIETTNTTDEDGNQIPFASIDNAAPGETYSKIPQVKNIDDGAAWVRIRIKQTAVLSDGTSVPVTDDSLGININTSYWLFNGDGFYYYYRPLAAGEITEPLFTEVSIKADLSNVYNGATFHMDLVAHAVQTANNGNGIDVYTAEGWPEE